METMFLLFITRYPTVMRARSGEGPSLVENLTYAGAAIQKAIANLYRTQEEIEEWKQFDPIIHIPDGCRNIMF